MASHLDLEEQEQLDRLKHFWRQYGNLITGLVLVVLLAFAAWNFYQYWQRSQASQAAALYDEVERTARSADLDKLGRVLGEMQSRFASTVYAQQSSLLAAKSYVDGGRVEAAQAALKWVTEKSVDEGYVATARLRLAALLIEQKKYDVALAELSGAFPAEFMALVADRRGDVYLAQGRKAEAVAEFQKAYQALDPASDYRRLVDVKLAALGVTPRTSGSPTDSGLKP